MIDPAVAYDGEYGTYNRGHVSDVFLKQVNGSESLGVVWPGSRFDHDVGALRLLTL